MIYVQIQQSLLVSKFLTEKKNKTKPNKNYMKSTECFHCEYLNETLGRQAAIRRRQDRHSMILAIFATHEQRLHSITLFAAVYDEE